MNILHIVNSINSTLGGITYALSNIVSLETAIGYHTTIATLHEHNSVDIEFSNKISIHKFSKSFPKRFARSQSLISWLHSNCQQYDLVIFHSSWFIIIHEAAALCNKLNVPYLLWPHGSLDPFDLKKKWILKKIVGPLLLQKTLRNAWGICCTSQLEADRLESYGSHPNKIVMPLSVPERNLKGERDLFRQKHGIKSEEFVFLFLSRIDYKKGLNLLIPAFNLLLKTLPNCRLIIAGSDSNGYEKKMRKLVQKRELQNKIHFVGFLDGQNKVDAFKASDCFVLPSLNENYGIAIIEALQYELPVIISNNVYIWKEIIDEGAGWMCQYNMASVHDTMYEAAKNTEEWLKRKKATKRAAQLFSEKEIFTRFSKMYINIINSTHQ